jgi:hypothetical protein
MLTMSKASTRLPISVDISLRCNSCGFTAPGFPVPLFKCPNHAADPCSDHVLLPSDMSAIDLEKLAMQAKGAESDENPFLRYRSFLYPYRVAVSQGMSDGKVRRDCEEP